MLDGETWCRGRMLIFGGGAGYRQRRLWPAPALLPAILFLCNAGMENWGFLPGGLETGPWPGMKNIGRGERKPARDSTLVFGEAARRGQGPA